MPKPRKEEVQRLAEVLSSAGLSVIDNEKIKEVMDFLPL